MNREKKYWISTNEIISVQTRDILNEYLLSLKLANKAEATISKYCSILERFFSECTIPINDLTSEDILKWFQAYSIDKKEKTLVLVLSTLCSFFKFCVDEDYLDKMVIKNRWRPKIPQTLPKYLDEHEYTRVKMAAEHLTLRDWALVLFLFSSGCRRFEVSQLTIEDIDFERRTAKVKGKGTKIRYIHFSEECAIILKEYLQTRSGNPTEPLFLNKFGNTLGRNGIYNITTKLGKMVGLEQSLNPHRLRHTFATNPKLEERTPRKSIRNRLKHYSKYKLLINH